MQKKESMFEPSDQFHTGFNIIIPLANSKENRHFTYKIVLKHVQFVRLEFIYIIFVYR